MNTSNSTASNSSLPTPPQHPAWKKRLPMALTLARMAVCPLIVIFLSLEGAIWAWLAAILFIAASITDWFDGYYARKFNAITNMGKFMDPIADKILVASALIMLIPGNLVNPVLVLVLLVRDILIGGIRAVAAADHVIIDAKTAGKWKTGMQMVAIPALLVKTPLLGLPTLEIGTVLLWISVILSVISGTQYTLVYWQARRAD